MAYARDSRAGRAYDEDCQSRSTGGRAVEDGLALLIGAGIGVGLMYVLDPQHGADRRAWAKRRAQQMMESTGAGVSTALGATAGRASKLTSRVRDRLSDAYDSASDYASDASSDASSKASGMFSNVASYGRDMYDKARSGMSHLFHRASDAGSDATDRAGNWLSSAKDYAAGYVPHIETQEDRDRHFWGQMSCAVGSLAIGAGILYFADPSQGRSRRAMVRDKFVGFANDIGDFSRRTGRHLSNKFRGYASEGASMTRSMMGREEPVDDRTLAERIRAELGHWTDKAGDIQVVCTNGRVMLTGNAPPAELDRIVSVISGIRGVTGVDNQLTTGVGA